MDNEAERSFEDPEVLRNKEEEESEETGRKTEQGDDLERTHSAAKGGEGDEEPYRPPRQPTLERPDEKEEKRGAGE
ncbi:MAG TPA: hypothetical protein VGR10_06645 [Thermoleophilaceae bacterium]|nr:hypothetical protein [Thermoleophilaceae bacterium]